MGCDNTREQNTVLMENRVQSLRLSKPAIRVAITGAAGQIGGFLTHMIAQGNMFGPSQRVILQLIELPAAE